MADTCLFDSVSSAQSDESSATWLRSASQSDRVWSTFEVRMVLHLYRWRRTLRYKARRLGVLGQASPSWRVYICGEDAISSLVVYIRSILSCWDDAKAVR